MLSGSYQDLFTAVSSCAAALTGLLFVAMSVAPSQGTPERPAIVQQVRAGAAILCFTNALSVSLFGLVPGNNLGYAAVPLSVIGLFFTAAGARSIVANPPAQRKHKRRQISFIVLLLCLFGSELLGGIRLLVHRHNNGAAELVGNLLVAMLLIGIARAWEMVGDRETGILASIAVLAGRGPDTPPPGEQPDAEPAE
ncbi:hypothetical protein GXW83_20895 [Streptacidiphilus sp. PB12-B1b]|uniref:hypothetical protein n=1 Tax=Streptacidiphilus sp. PB12-B1b TaxID=2705012 RepID=UPI0015FD42B6|nr:hypothetical protein [Streptacidiphilus sp. PB12-B1b]QMU77782.1 hypothetical protein GXW83_20895 [Streptacidiphilus sp. PB12-B1b]